MLNTIRYLIKQTGYLREPLLKPEYNITRGDASLKQFALTFDGHPGGDPIFTPDVAAYILELLQVKKIQCTFFLTGQFIESFPAITRHIVYCGHEIGNHSYSHPHLDSIDKKAFESELCRTEEVFDKITGSKMMPYWRAPYGEFNRELWQVAAARGYRHVLWTCGRKEGQNFNSLDYVDDPASDRFFSSTQIMERLLSSRHKNGAIALLHLGARKHDPFYVKLPELIDKLISLEYRIVTISQLVNKDKGCYKRANRG